jgi:phosphoribosylanthranilate isomerase
MSVFIKICGLRDADHAAAAAEAGADALGFVFARSVRQISAQQAKNAASGLPAAVKRVAVMRHPTNSEWQLVLNEFRPDVLQTDSEDFAGLDVPEQVRCWPVIREGCAVESLPNVFVYEGANSGAGETVDWTRAAALARQGQMILAGGLAADNVSEAIQTVRPWGVDVSSAVESGPGEKDIELIQQFIGAVRAAESDS